MLSMPVNVLHTDYICSVSSPISIKTTNFIHATVNRYQDTGLNKISD